MKDSFKLKFHFHEYIEFIEDFYLGRVRENFVEELRENLIFKGGISKFCPDIGLYTLLDITPSLYIYWRWINILRL